MPRTALPVVLVVTTDERVLQRAHEALLELATVRAVAPQELEDPSRFVDAAAAIALLDKRTGEEIEALAPVTELPAGGALVLLATDVPEPTLETAIHQLRPALVLPHPSPLASLRLALARLLPPRRGQGARLHHRPARALLGVSAAIRDVLEQVRRVAPTPIPVLILGETGTGKELLARALHDQSPRAKKSFVAVNCSALPDTLLEAELFGARRGAFTGLERDRKGLFEEADGGTLFLDEIGETSPAFQAKLLRAIETREIRALGTTAQQPVDVRIVSATHRDIDAALAEGSFRQDLLFRLNAVTLHLPPLRRRRVDIPFLAQHFAEEFGQAQARRIVLDEGLVEALSRHDFPGNVRELRNAMERAITLAGPDGPVTAEHLQLGESGAPGLSLPHAGTLRDRVEQLELSAIREALRRHGGNRTRAAEELGLSRLGLRQKMRRLGIVAR
jgi:transcriptional regulator with PAS, ATPase and Fis domain